METKSTKQSDIVRIWHKVDVKDQILGRIAVDIANRLMGKRKPYFVHYLDCGDFVVVINAKDVKVTGAKDKKKIYYRHSNFPTGQKSETLEKLRQRKPEEIIKRAVKGMLPKNKLRPSMMKRLLIYKGEQHPYTDKFKGGS